ncbi:DUF1990 family protein [Actinomadura sp. HBU206391]|uniref:DUF1990 family protein n=1 Tax=Actinomadura sp. HBU206391 TaxID=2731692 RepID=UPI00164F1CD6|nr:DUF1990 domain-containing protein [Actinomadura sp. HBU206391]MBC6461926.1 DUF1990 domain-containing protein [Actinomadura sp. HBU206391]
MNLTYQEVAATRDGRLPEGYRHLRHRTLVGTGPAVMAAASDAMLEWWMHRAAGVRIAASAPRARPGVHVNCEVGVGPLRFSAPALVVWAEEGERRTGFGYGTLPGHFAAGEEGFVVERDDIDDVWLTVLAFSRPAEASGRLAPFLQRFHARRCGAVLRRLVSS